MSNEELVRKERERREKKLYKQLEKQQKKLAAKGIHVDIDTLKKDYETQRAGGKSTLNLEAALAAAGAEGDIDVVGGIDDSFDMDSDVEGDTKTSQETQIRLKQMEADIKRKISPIGVPPGSIYTLTLIVYVKCLKSQLLFTINCNHENTCIFVITTLLPFI